MTAIVYEVPAAIKPSPMYEVTVNGQKVFVYPCNTSTITDAKDQLRPDRHTINIAAPAAFCNFDMTGPVEVVGYLRHDARRGWLMPDNDVAGNHWFWFDLPAMSRRAGLAETATFYLEADTTPNPGNLPVGGQTQIQLPSNHLQYAITWYVLAAGFAVIYVLWHRRRPGERP